VECRRTSPGRAEQTGRDHRGADREELEDLRRGLPGLRHGADRRGHHRGEHGPGKDLDVPLAATTEQQRQRDERHEGERDRRGGIAHLERRQRQRETGDEVGQEGPRADPRSPRLARSRQEPGDGDGDRRDLDVRPPPEGLGRAEGDG
jgi:hypothetical protein